MKVGIAAGSAIALPSEVVDFIFKAVLDGSQSQRYQRLDELDTCIKFVELIIGCEKSCLA